MMFKYLWDLLFHSCKHKWVHKETWENKRFSTITYVLHCQHCGKIKVKRV